MQKFIISYVTMFTEVDDYEKGCVGNTHLIDHAPNKKLKGIDSVLKYIESDTGVSRENFDLNACDENGRIDVQYTSDENGVKLTDSELDRWRKGSLTAYLCNISYYVYKMQKFDIAAEINKEI